jgi:excisionase family DNA binding protein
VATDASSCHATAQHNQQRTKDNVNLENETLNSENDQLHLVAASVAGSTPERLLTATEVAEFLSVHPNYVYDAAKNGEIPSYKFGGNRRFRWSEVESWLQRTYVQPSLQATRTEGG